MSILCISLCLLLHVTLGKQTGGEGFTLNTLETALNATKIRKGQSVRWDRYRSLPLAEIHTKMKDLAAKYPKIVTVFTSQEKYGLPSSCHDWEWHEGCLNYVLVIEDKKIYSDKTTSGKKAIKERPDVLLLGTLHGDERVGPTAVMEASTLLVEAASCMSTIDTCKTSALVQTYGMDQVAWLARLASTRRIIVVPAGNANGYEKNQRQENGVDPNRDFSFDQSANQCMQTIAARTINEIFLDHLIQMAVTYHGGIELISYGWGIDLGGYKISPDDTAQRILGNGLSKFAGELYGNGVGDQRFYRSGDILTLLYHVRGGFEDWAYGSSWKSDKTSKCKPNTNGGYSTSKTVYDDSTLRALNVIVEVSNMKGPNSNQYGSNRELLNPPFLHDNNENNGYATKHVRTALMIIDLVQPYVEIHKFNQEDLPAEIEPMRKMTVRWCRDKKKVTRKKGKSANVHWRVGGSFEVSETFLVYGLWSDFGRKFNGINQVNKKQMKSILENTSGKFGLTAPLSGNTRWTDANLDLDPSFKSKIELSKFSEGDEIAVYAVAMVDQNWKEIDTNKVVWPSNVRRPQSHVVNARTNPKWRKNKPKIQKVVQGRLHWISVPLTIKIK